MPTRAAPRLPFVNFLEHRTRGQRWVAAAVVVAIVSWITLRGIARVMLDRWWLDSVTDAPVWSRRTTAQVQMGAGAAVIVLAILGTSVWIVLRLSSTDHDQLHRGWQRYHERLGPAHRWALIGLTVYLTWHIAGAATGYWQQWLLWRHGGDLGTPVPRLGTDLGFHLFQLPLLVTVSSFVRLITLVTLLIATFGHFASGALRWPGSNRSSSPGAIAHLTLLAIVLLAMQALHDVVVARPMVATNRVGAFDGPGFTETEFTRPALVVAAASCVLLGFTILLARNRWRGVVLVSALVGAVHLIGLVIAPQISERLLVAPAEAQRQLWSIENNLAATRQAYGLEAVHVVRRPLIDGTTGVDLGDERFSERGIPLFTTASMSGALQVLAGTTGTRIRNVDLAEYDVDGTSRPVYTAARPANKGDLPETGWVQQHLVYTHGDGAVAVLADEVDADGRPDVSGRSMLNRAAHTPWYFGEGLENWYAVARTRRVEAGGVEYQGSGVRLDSFVRRLALGVALGESQPVLTTELDDDSILLYRRGIAERVGAIAPFLALDRDPYMVIDGAEVTWVVDAYTTASTYPYAQFAPANSSPAFAGSNYVHASVLITIDGSDGDVHLYRTDGDAIDPIIDVWDRVFPSLFDPIDELPETIEAHIRYPEDLFDVQTLMLGRYHVDDAEALFAGTDRWTVSPAAPTTVGAESNGAAPAVDLFSIDGEFRTVRTFGPGAAGNPQATRDELSASASAAHSLDRSLDVVVPTGDPLLSSQVAQSAIDADPELAQQITLLNANGSHVEFGPMTPILVDDHVLWARPIIVVGTSPAAAPRLYGVAVVSNGIVAIGADLTAALRNLP